MKQTRYLVYTALMAALATIFYVFLEFPVPFFPPFLRMDFSDTFALIAGMTMGPVAGVMVQIIKNMIKVLMTTYSGGVGELMNAIVGIALILPPALLYRKKKTQSSLVIGLIIGAIVMVVVGGITNYFIALPLYAPELTHEGRIDMILYGLTPFNVFKAVVSGIMSYVLFNALKAVFKYMEI